MNKNQQQQQQQEVAIEKSKEDVVERKTVGISFPTKKVGSDKKIK